MHSMANGFNTARTKGTHTRRSILVCLVLIKACRLYATTFIQNNADVPPIQYRVSWYRTEILSQFRCFQSRKCFLSYLWWPPSWFRKRRVSSFPIVTSWHLYVLSISYLLSYRYVFSFAFDWKRGAYRGWRYQHVALSTLLLIKTTFCHGSWLADRTTVCQSLAMLESDQSLAEILAELWRAPGPLEIIACP